MDCLSRGYLQQLRAPGLSGREKHRHVRDAAPARQEVRRELVAHLVLHAPQQPVRALAAHEVVFGGGGFDCLVSGAYFEEARGLLGAVVSGDERVLQVVFEHLLVFERTVVDEVAAVEVAVRGGCVHLVEVDGFEAVRGEVVEEELERGVSVEGALVEGVLGADCEEQHEVRVGDHLVVEADALVVREREVRDGELELEVDVRVHALAAHRAPQVLHRVLQPAHPLVRRVQRAEPRLQHVRPAPVLEELLHRAPPQLRLELADLPEHVRHFEQQVAVQPRGPPAQLLHALHQRRAALLAGARKLPLELAVLLRVVAQRALQAPLGPGQVHVRDDQRVCLFLFGAAGPVCEQAVLAFERADGSLLELGERLLCLGEFELGRLERVVVVAGVCVGVCVGVSRGEREAGDGEDGAPEVLVELICRHANH